MMRKSQFIIILSSLFIFFITDKAYSYGVKLHRYYNGSISSKTLENFNLSSYLQLNLGLNKGTEAKINGETVANWLSYGGVKEDDATPWLGPLNPRPSNHFHNPLEPFDEAGFTGIWGSGLIEGDSALLFAQKDVGTQSPGGYYSWRDARQYYFNALTATDNVSRETNFADNFRALGQVMHLVQDMSVPEHARNDGHYRVMKTLETWADEALDAKKFPNKNAILVNALTSPINFDTTELSQAIPLPEGASPFAKPYVPIARLFDNEIFTRLNPGLTAQSNIGLSEYTNANFVSAGSLFPRDFPYPDRATSVTVATCEIDDPINIGGKVSRPYYVKTGDGETKVLKICGTTSPVSGYLLAGVDYFYVYRKQFHLNDPDYEILPIMDDEVYADYAKLLLPRAVGYSTALLEYFFRGQLELVPDPAGDNTYRISNLSDERMTGNFGLYHDNPEGVRQLLWSKDLDISPKGDLLEYIDPPLSLVEWNKYTLVFRGRLGAEDGAVVGKALSANWREEWDEGLKGVHPWAITDIDLLQGNPSGGQRQVAVVDGRLVMDSARPAGTISGQLNQVYLGRASDRLGDTCYLGDEALPCDFTREFPRVISPGTMLRVKIDKMSINQPVPEQSCAWPAEIYQGIMLTFSCIDGSGQKAIKRIMVTIPEHETMIFPRLFVTPGEETSINLYWLLSNLTEFTPPVTLESIDIVQQMLILCSPLTIDHAQHMEIDYIRLEEQ